MGLPPRGRDHLPAGLRLGPLRDACRATSTWYRAFVFGFPTVAFPIDSVVGFLVFHGLVWASFLVIAGVMLALRRRMRDHGAAALQQFGEDILPLFLLFAISVTGLMLTASYTWMKGYAYDFLAILHAITVIFTLLWLPFGKFFHIFQRPAQLGVSFYKDVGAARRAGAAAAAAASRSPRRCMCGPDRSSGELGFRYEMSRRRRRSTTSGSARAAGARCFGLAQGGAVAPSRRPARRPTAE